MAVLAHQPIHWNWYDVLGCQNLATGCGNVPVQKQLYSLLNTFMLVQWFIASGIFMLKKLFSDVSSAQ